ncbi:MAG TPA: M56 family metallopeptidase [Gemmatimonadaceae bacterium]|nr:M56 family metallopeptidase [Gemmatimonadaceae bacterium]
MIVAWMLASTIFALLLGVAAAALERALRGLGRQARLPWLMALGVGVAWPIVALSASRLFGARVAVAPILPARRSAATIIASGLPTLPLAWLNSHMETALLALWAGASLVLFARLLLALRTLIRVERSAAPDVLEGVPVLVTPVLGPAVFGVGRARMIMPRWLLDLDAPLRALVLRHEQEHCRARDPQLVLGAAIGVALVPWNVGAWWMARRLRLAVELDCDVRVLRATEDPQRYSRLLLFIAQRQSQTRLAPMLAESSSHLSRRIAAMNASRPALPVVRAVTLVLGAAGAIAVACSPRVGQDLTAPTPTAGRAVTNLAPGASPVYFEFQIEKPVMQVPDSPAPLYPSILKSAGIEGEVLASFVVGPEGLADTASFKVLKSTHELFTIAVRNALSAMRFVPAEVRGRKVRQLVQQPFVFAIAGSAGSAAGKSQQVIRPNPSGVRILEGVKVPPGRGTKVP